MHVVCSFMTHTGIYILSEKLPKEEWHRLLSLAGSLGAAVCDDRRDANILLTDIRAPKRIERHTSEEERATKAIVNVAWLDTCAKQRVCVDMEAYRAYGLIDGRETDSLDLDATPTPPSSREGSTEPTDSASRPMNMSDWVNSEFAVFRRTPLVSEFNQPLVDELQVLREHRRLTGDATSEMAYMRAASAVKAYPLPLRDVSEEKLRTIKGIGAKVATLIRQFYDEGGIAEVCVIRHDQAIQTQLQFMMLYGIGPRTAQRAYQEGCRTLEDVTRRQHTHLSSQLGPAASLALLPDLSQRISHYEVQWITEEIMQDMRGYLPDARHTICGSVRRGKEEVGDIDLVITSEAEPDNHSFILEKLLSKWREDERLTHTISVTQPESHGRVHVAEIVYVSHYHPQPVHRRVDLVFVAQAQYGAAILAWTGSITYERDLRRWARARGYMFSHMGLVHLDTMQLEPTPTEASVFELLGLPAIPPTLRNAD
ncbi:DNA repair protein [Malassezia pachydermatis]